MACAAATYLAAVLFLASGLPALAEAVPDPAVSAAFPAVEKMTIATTPVQAPDYSELTSEERLTVQIFDRNTPSVVNIANLAAYTRKCGPTDLLLSRHVYLHYFCEGRNTAIMQGMPQWPHHPRLTYGCSQRPQGIYTLVLGHFIPVACPPSDTSHV